MSDSEFEYRDDGDSDYASKSRGKARPRRKVATSNAARTTSTAANASILGKIPEIAKVDIVATDSNGVADVAEEDDKLSKINSDVLKRIQSALALAQHPNTGVAEAHNAMRVASRLMAKENITQADLIARETEAEKSKRAGMSTVNIVPNPDYRLARKRKNDDDDDAVKLVQNKSWHETNDAENIADGFLKRQGIKISVARARGRNKRDAHAYAQGKEDSKKIDVKRRRLENAKQGDD
ncbi:hypothetical protein FRC00_001030 [Tulasnella sp. 408]|nr:hypothetical protein FRC00_001030 [Tulasnella sp. 408]